MNVMNAMKAVTHQDNARWPLLPIEQVADVNPRIEKSAIPDDLPVSFVPMPAVGAGDGLIRVDEIRPAREVKKGFTAFLEGDVLFAKITPCMENGKMAVVPRLVNGYGFGSTEFHVLRPKAGMDAKYIYYFISSQTFRSEAERHMTGAVGQRRVPTSYLKECKIPVAPLDQQKRIVAEIEKQFSRLDEAAANLKRVKANLKRYKAAVLKAAVEGRLVETEAELARREGRSYETGEQLLQRILETRRSQWQGKGKYKEPAAPDTTDLPELPEGWVWAQLENAISGIVVGYVGPVKEYMVGKSNTRFLSTTHIGENEFIENEFRYVSDEFDRKNRKSSVVPGDILIARHGDSGKACLVPDQIPRAQVSNAVIVHPNSEITNPVYLMYAINATRRELQKRKVGGVQQVVNTKSMGTFPIPIPPRPEQDEIVKQIELRLSVLNETEAQMVSNLQRAERLRQAFLSHVFSDGLLNDSRILSTRAAAGAA